ncbi:ImmA/IrrE family metallo-endopeptidase [Niveibacterium sp.]|uniref:ImmA/IrrE family metallo-endopeptidase n=1 Tax=Niveibacterium sp. TaxID=2017444 RepID=UPI0035B077D0
MTEPYSSRRDGMVVPPRTNVSINKLAAVVRDSFGLTGRKFFPIVELYELLDELVPGASFEVLEPHEMGDDHGLTRPDRGVISLRSDVYEGAFNGRPRDRFTMAHELGHLLMHRQVTLKRVDPAAPPKIYCNSEWQADKFSSYLLLPTHLIREYDSLELVAADFGVSYEAAQARRDDMKRVTKW